MSEEVDLRKQRKVSAEVTIDTAGLATEAKQDDIIVLLEAIEPDIESIKTNVANINSNIDSTLSSRATENTLVDTKNAVLQVRDRLPSSLGQQTMADSLPVVFPSDQSPIPISGSITASSDKVATSVRTTVNVSSAATLILASNVNRKKFKIFNDAGAIIYFGDNNTITVTAFSFRLSNNEYYEDSLPVYTGNVYAIRGAGTGNVHVTEYTT